MLKDIEFIRDKVPMTKEEIRHLSILKLDMDDQSVLYDIGCGTGSVACEAAHSNKNIQVFGIECKSEAVELSKKNVEHFGLENVRIIEAMAPAGFDKLPKATHAFIGGSRGNMFPILEALYAINPTMKVVVTAVTLETIALMNEIEERFNVKNFEMVAIQISNVRKVGNYHMLQGENPVYMCCFEFCE